MPVITTSTLNVVIPLMLDDTLRVSVAVAIWLAVNVVLSLSQVMVIGPLALIGFQFAFVMVSVIWLVPVFLTYTVLAAELPGATDPQLIDVSCWVHELSE